MAPDIKPEFLIDQPILRAQGDMVRARLKANPQVWQAPTDEAEIYAVGHFLTPEECQSMITMIDAAARPSTLLDMSYGDGFRTSFSGDVDPHDPFIKRIDSRINDLLGIDARFGETIQGQRYLPGQEFKPHHDWFHPGTVYWDSEVHRGGQRAYTAMIYLNQVDEGGSTDFTELGLSVEPTQGVLMMWNNADPDGLPNRKTIHAGRPVVRGAKYVITKWYRAKPWT